MDFKYFGKTENAKLLLIPGLGVSYEIFSPLISRLEKDFCIIVVQVDGFILNKYSHNIGKNLKKKKKITQ